MKERPISITTGHPSKRGQRLRSADGLTWKQRNRGAVNERRRTLYAAEPQKYRDWASKSRRVRRVTVLAYNRVWSTQYRARIRAEMIAAYGGRCNCCEEMQPLFLQLDHIHNDGSLERRTHKTTAKLWAALKKLGWPRDRYQLLCANCNFGKLMNGGICPHANAQS